VSLHLDSAHALEVLTSMEAFGGEPVLVDAAALASLRCLSVSVSTAGPVPGRVAAETIAATLRIQHYQIEHAAGRWVVSADPTAPPKTCAPAAPVAQAESLDEVAGEIARSIRRVSETEYVLTRHGLEVFLEHMPALFRQVRFVPELQAKRVVGLRLSGLREGDTAERLGLLDGDRLERLAGHEVSSPDKALEAYAAVRSANRIVLEIMRQGAPMKIVYRVE
jgi:hypothetical protein